jgi:allophanate hydrolase
LKKDCTLVAVCGLHMRGFPLEKQLIQLGARFVRADVTAAKYQFIKLPTDPAKPGLIKNPTIGASIEVEIWEMSLASFGEFAASIPAPLGIGKVELKNGEEVPGFVCEGYAAKEGEDITGAGGWRAAMAMIKTLT